MMSLVTSEGKRLRRSANGRLVEISGQLLFDFASPARDAAQRDQSAAGELPAEYDELLNRALECESTSTYAEAAEVYQRMLVRWPADAQLWFNLGNVLYAGQQVSAAAAAFRTAAFHDPESAEAWNNLGAALLDLADWSGAEYALRQALRLAPGFSNALDNLNQLALECRAGTRPAGT